MTEKFIIFEFIKQKKIKTREDKEWKTYERTLNLKKWRSKSLSLAKGKKKIWENL